MIPDAKRAIGIYNANLRCVRAVVAQERKGVCQQ
jgi:hypothetical protein